MSIIASPDGYDCEPLQLYSQYGKYGYHGRAGYWPRYRHYAAAYNLPALREEPQREVFRAIFHETCHIADLPKRMAKNQYRYFDFGNCR